MGWSAHVTTWISGVWTLARRYFARPLVLAFVNWTIFGAATLSAIWLWMYPQPPGYAVALLGGAAVIMTFQEATIGHKVLWTVFAFAMVALELHSISVDRREQDADRARTQKSLNDDFSRIVSDNDRRFSATVLQNKLDFLAIEDHFNRLAQASADINNSTKSNLSLSRQSLLNVTGSNSYGLVMPQTFYTSTMGYIPFFVKNIGKYPLTDVQVVAIHGPNEPTAVLSVGTIYAGGSRSISYQIRPKLGEDSIVFLISAQNGQVSETLSVRPAPVKGEWETTYIAYRIRWSLAKDGNPDFGKHVLLYKKDWNQNSF